jgi:1-acyl-sn-glycerol-3-phosphate acyltransferase
MQTFSQFLAKIVLKTIGWQVVGNFPDIPKFVLVGAPHTSNWDFLLAMLLMYASGVRFNWIGKASLFRPPYGGFFRRLGGVPVWRERRNNFVSQIVEAFERSKRLIIAIAPEGTRSKIPYWKTGFYYMALGAKVPLVLGFIDYGRRQVGVGPLFKPSGDIRADFACLRDFYADKTGLYPEKQSAVAISPE